MASREYGPFVHTLNKGGLREIISTAKLRGTIASNNQAADRTTVRAYVGTFEHQKKNKMWKGKLSVHIEFTTSLPTNPGLPPGSAEWSGERLVHGYLPIKILRILNGDGETISA